MNELENLAEQRKCSLLMPYIAWKEAEAGNYKPRKFKVWEYYFIEPIQNESQRYWYSEIEKVVFPNGARTKSEENDIWVLVTAREMNYPIVTNDGGSKKQPGGILGNASGLRKLGIAVLRDYEALSLIKKSS